jgi:hypothetical protein
MTSPTVTAASSADLPPRRGRRLGPWLLAAGLALGVATGLRARHRPAAAGGDAAALAGAVEGRLRERAAALGARVATLAELPRLAAAVATDEATVRDLTHEELALRPRPGETITIGQRLRDGRELVLLVLPPPPPAAAGGPAEPGPLPRAGLETLPAPGGLLLRHTITVAPRERADELTGVLSATWPVAFAELLPPGARARLELDGHAVAGGDARSPGVVAGPAGDAAASGRDVVTAGLRLPGGRVATLAVPGAAAAGAPGTGLLLALAAALAVIGLCLGLGLVLARPAWRAPAAGGARASREVTAVAPPPGGATAMSPPPASGPVTAWPPSQGVRVGRYQIIRSLGSGGMAEVLLARAEGEAGFGRQVAIKVLHPPLAQHPAVVNLFLDEARLAASLDHPNIVQIQDLGRAGDQYYIAMEYIDGADLAHLIEALRVRRALIPLPIGIAILRRICDGLHAAHTARGPDGQPLHLVHRDVKSANVFVSRAGAVKIGDFGIAKASHALRLGRTEIGQVKGTPGYMAPEHRLGHAVDHRADVYGVGAVAYELFTSQPVYLEILTPASAAADGSPALRPMTALRPDLPADLQAVVARALADDPADRFADCADLDRALATLAALHGHAGDKDIGLWARGELERVVDLPAGVHLQPPLQPQRRQG